MGKAADLASKLRQLAVAVESIEQDHGEKCPDFSSVDDAVDGVAESVSDLTEDLECEAEDLEEEAEDEDEG